MGVVVANDTGRCPLAIPVPPPSVEAIDEFIEEMRLANLDPRVQPMLIQVAIRHQAIQDQISTMDNIAATAYQDRVVERMFRIETNIINSKEINFEPGVTLCQQAILCRINEIGLLLMLSTMYHNVAPRLFYAGGEVQWGENTRWNHHIE